MSQKERVLCNTTLRSCRRGVCFDGREAEAATVVLLEEAVMDMLLRTFGCLGYNDGWWETDWWET